MPRYTEANPPPLVRPGEKTLFTPVRDWLAQRTEISWPAKFLYSRLERYAGKRIDARPTQAALAREMGVPERTLRRYVAELRVERDGMPLLWVERAGKDGVARYLFPAHPWRAEVPVDNSGRALSGSAKNDLTGGVGPAKNDLTGASPYKGRARGFGDNVKRRQTAAASGDAPPGRSPSTKAWAEKNTRRLAALVAGIGKSIH